MDSRGCRQGRRRRSRRKMNARTRTDVREDRIDDAGRDSSGDARWRSGDGERGGNLMGYSDSPRLPLLIYPILPTPPARPLTKLWIVAFKSVSPNYPETLNDGGGWGMGSGWVWVRGKGRYGETRHRTGNYFSTWGSSWWSCEPTWTEFCISPLACCLIIVPECVLHFNRWSVIVFCPFP